jgi:hypothetical protein
MSSESLSQVYCGITFNVPLNTSQDGRHVIGRAPAVLQDIKAKLPRTIDIRMEHLADKLDTWRLVGVLFLEMHDQAECTIFERGIGGANDDGIPRDGYVSHSITTFFRCTDESRRMKNPPGHDIVSYWRC